MLKWVANGIEKLWWTYKEQISSLKKRPHLTEDVP